MIEEEGSVKLYFVVASKGSFFDFDRRGSENAKIDCGREHFQALGNDVRFETAYSFQSLTEYF
ncbi:hypothetical protein [Sulfurovum sp.]|uniref:restriction endonuclease n=1 Tax=Sulfurovum sp. TaxID=1969726 RepID=UPI0035638A70